MAAVIASCCSLGKKLTHCIMAAVCLPNSRTHLVLWRRDCLQYKQVTGNEDLPVFMGRNKKKLQK
ncbi:28S ribosomal protein S18c, mitochondrial-like isoform X2 [Sciurus carolinensis]|uniref:28S ribosomal protein S18c, mitochondrial-like isoform X2 n=1 Tax=Sciurus carolinensis TaxID=30640 RepID=UPI001FB4299E|nr:28S ribosomal protein S18c, mitochondrial-like isoform X2 [Sciurus carolinensis]